MRLNTDVLNETFILLSLSPGGLSLPFPLARKLALFLVNGQRFGKKCSSLLVSIL